MSSTAAVQETSEVLGSAPRHSLYALLQHPDSPQTYPPKVNAMPLMALTRAVRPLGGLANFWHPSADEASAMDTQTNSGIHPLTLYAAPTPGQKCPRVARFPSGVSSLDDVFGDVNSVLKDAATADGALILVCTHGARDCRCGTSGGALFDALRRELKLRRQNSREEDDQIWEKIRLGEVAHVGGHKYAANVLAFPVGDWLGNLQAEHAAAVLDGVASQLRALSHIEQQSDDELDSGKALVPPVLSDASHWRGRMGLDKDTLEAFLRQCEMQ